MKVEPRELAVAALFAGVIAYTVQSVVLLHHVGDDAPMHAAAIAVVTPSS